MGSLQSRLPTGLPGLDEVLHGGLLPRRAYIVRGGPGTGKTTLGLHFLMAGAARGEKTLLITLKSSEARVREDALTLGMDLSGIDFLDLSPTSEFFAENRSYDIFLPAEVERGPMTDQIVQVVTRSHPARVLIDSFNTLRYLAADPFQLRKQAISFLRFLVEEGATVLVTSEPTAAFPDDDIRYVSDGILDLDFTPRYGGLRRTLIVTKLDGSDFSGGPHSFRLTGRGMEVYPRLIPEEHERVFTFDTIASGVPELDLLLGGGVERGTLTVLSGPSGTGKTSVGMTFMQEAAKRGERSVVYVFEELPETLLYRCEAIGLPARAMIEAGTLAVVPIEPLRYSPDEFALLVRQEVEQRGARIVMIDGVSGYRLTLAGEDLEVHIHALGRYLRNMGVTAFFTGDVESITGNFYVTEFGISYLADNLIFLRYLEIRGDLRKVIGVLKKRVGDFGKKLREMEITERGVRVGEPLTGLRGILSGTPEWVNGPPPRA